MRRFLASRLESSGILIVYDLERGTVADNITDYSIYLSEELRRDEKTVSQNTRHIVGHSSYLDRMGRDERDAVDSDVTAYVNEEIELVSRNARSRGSKRAIMSTVNQKVGAVLGWYVWLQSKGRVITKKIGPYGCHITAWPASRNRDLDSFLPGRPIASDHFLRGAGTSGLTPSVDEGVYDALLEQIDRSALSTFIAHRDALLIDIAKHAGFRRASICSLRVAQFAATAECTTDTFTVKPDSQKFGYENTFEIDTLLALRVRAFIDGPRAEFLQKRGIDVSLTQDRLFISERSGRPIKERSLSQRISRSMRAIGQGKGRAIHVFRGLHANEFVEAETNRRAERGLDTSTMSVASAVATKLGQRRPESLFPYVADRQSQIAHRDLAMRRKGARDTR